ENTAPKIGSGLTPDTQPGWVRGWGVYRSEPWRLYAVCGSKTDALAMKADAGTGFHVRYGSHCLGTDDFITSSDNIRWVPLPVPAERLNAKRVFARFITKDRGQYEGVGEIRLR